jgi:hypothetical protein
MLRSSRASVNVAFVIIAVVTRTGDARGIRAAYASGFGSSGAGHEASFSNRFSIGVFRGGVG